MENTVQMETKIVKLKLDIIFKRLFADKRNTHVLKRFISDILDIPFESIKEYCGGKSRDATGCT